ncbi:MAG TPA: NUDIX hydrolase [Burkholderiales bacterium]|nr:NUDIX hydrolase [Burkholderiales bacterium]
MVWKPDVTVAAIAERDGRFLFVEEQTERGLLFNQPAGHLENDESIVAAVARETLEETAWEFFPEHLVGVYRWCPSGSEVTYLRFAFSGRLGRHFADRALDTGIVRVAWLSPEEIRAGHHRHRSPLVVRCMEDYLAGARAPLGLLVDYDRTGIAT